MTEPSPVSLPGAAPAAPLPLPTNRWALAGLALSALLSSLGTSIANVALPTLAQAFAASFSDVQWVVLAYLLSLTTLVVGAGRLGDLAGRRRLLLAGLAIYSAAALACGLAPTLGWLVAARAVQGLGAALLVALALASVGEIAPPARLGSALGLLGSMSAVGTALGPSLGGALTATVGWRAIFLVQVPLGVAASFLVRRHLPAPVRRHDANAADFDLRGLLLLAVTLAAFSLALAPHDGPRDATNLMLFAGAACGLAAFAYVELRSPAPLVRLALFRGTALGGSLAQNALVSTVIMATLLVGPFYLSVSLGLAAGAAGLAMSLGPLVAALSAAPAGHLTDRLGVALPARCGLIAMAGSAALLAMLPASLGLVGYLAPIVVLTAGYSLFQTANNTAALAAVTPQDRGIASGLLNLSRHLGLILGTAALGALFASAAGTADPATASPQAIGEGMRATFGAAALLLAAVVAAGAIGPGFRSSGRGVGPAVEVRRLEAVGKDVRGPVEGRFDGEGHGDPGELRRVRRGAAEGRDRILGRM